MKRSERLWEVAGKQIDSEVDAAADEGNEAMATQEGSPARA
jgi:hypothetical protein